MRVRTKTTRKELDEELRTLPSSKWDAALGQHVDTDTFGFSLYLFILIGCCKPMVRLTCWLQTARHVSLSHSLSLAKPGARAAHERSSNFDTTTKTSTKLVAPLQSSLRSVFWRCRRSKLSQPLLLVPTMVTEAGSSSRDYVFGDYPEGKGGMASRLANHKRCATKPWFHPTMATCDWHQE